MRCWSHNKCSLKCMTPQYPLSSGSSYAFLQSTSQALSSFYIVHMAGRVGPGVGKPQTFSTAKLHSGNTKSNDNLVPRSQSALTVGGARKHLPQIPANAAASSGLLAPPSPMTMDRSMLPAGGDAIFQPFFLEYALTSEYGAVAKDRFKLQGIYVIPSANSALVWNGVLFVRQGLYEDGVFRFTVHIPSNFPDGDCPSIVFDPPVFHPVIDPVTGNLDVVRAFHKWRRTINRISHVLLYARRIFLKIESQNPLNKEAADLYENNLTLYKERVTESIKHCKEALYKDPDPTDAHAIRFSPWDPAVHESALEKMLQAKNGVSTKTIVQEDS